MAPDDASQSSDPQPDANELRDRMAHLRARMDDEVVETLEQARELRDWRTYVRRYPWLCVAAAATAGYLLVPRRSSPGESAHSDEPGARSGLRSGLDTVVRSVGDPLRSIVTAAARRTATNLAANRLSQTVEALFARSAASTENEDSEHGSRR